MDFKTKAQGADWLLNQWVGKIDKLLNTLDKANHLIHKEAISAQGLSRGVSLVGCFVVKYNLRVAAPSLRIVSHPCSY